MHTRLERFRKEMEPAKELFSSELTDFAKGYDSLGEMTLTEEPDIDTQEYIFSFENLNGTSKDELERIYLEISNHMRNFSKDSNIENFSQFVRFWF